MDVDPRDCTDTPVTITGMSYGLTATIDLQRRAELPTLSSPLVSSVMYKMRYVFVYGQAQSTHTLTLTHSLTLRLHIYKQVSARNNDLVAASVERCSVVGDGLGTCAWVRGYAHMHTCICAYHA